MNAVYLDSGFDSLDSSLKVTITRILKAPIFALIKMYRFFISPLMPSACRFYPSCSVYALSILENASIFNAYKIAYRILRCQPLSKGGIDYPLISYNPKKVYFINPCCVVIRFWLVPYKNNLFYVIPFLK